jgi:hypothetical protein
MRTRSPQAALPDSPTASGDSMGPAPAGDARWRIASGGYGGTAAGYHGLFGARR